MPFGPATPPILPVADGAMTAGAIVTHPFVIPSGAGVDTDIVINGKIEVLEMVIRLLGDASPGDSVQLKNGTDPITEDVGLGPLGDDTDLMRNDTIDSAFAVVEAFSTLRITSTTAGAFPGAFVTVHAIRRP